VELRRWQLKRWVAVGKVVERHIVAGYDLLVDAEQRAEGES